MKFLEPANCETYVGLAYGVGMPEFIASHCGLVDYLEIPFEQLRASPQLAQIQCTVPFLLHCASLSIAGFVPPEAATVDAIVKEAIRTATPWIGEHLAFVAADGLGEDAGGHGEPISLTYTICPQLSEATAHRVSENLATLRPLFAVPLILENSPQYFQVPGSTMNMVDFINEVASGSDVSLLLDLSHFLITARNTGVDPIRELDRLPLEKVVEVHMSGLSNQAGVSWDDHSSPAPPELFQLLERLTHRVRPRAVTFEYNWSPDFPTSVIVNHVERARQLLEAV